MAKDIQPALHANSFECVRCDSKYQLSTTIKKDKISIDVCSNCHPFYTGAEGTKALRGRADKLSSQFDTGLANVGKTTVKKERVKKEKTKTSLSDL